MRHWSTSASTALSDPPEPAVCGHVSLKSTWSKLNCDVFLFQDHFRADYELKVIKKKQRNEHKNPKVTLASHLLISDVTCRQN